MATSSPSDGAGRPLANWQCQVSDPYDTLAPVPPRPHPPLVEEAALIRWARSSRGGEDTVGLVGVVSDSM